ncbi:MAG: glycosyltransferase family 9 protein [Candidatus Spyradosoma sp.]
MYVTQIFGKTRFSQFSTARELPLPSEPFLLNCSVSENGVRKKFTGTVPYITLQRGVQNADSATRCWSVEKYEAFVSAFKERFPQVKVVQLGAASTKAISGCDLDLRGKTSFEELKALLKYGVFHLDGECGMVHLKHVLGGRSVVLFGPTSEKFKGYPENVNLSDRPCPHVCEWLSSKWDKQCLFTGTCESLCMNSISPEAVLDAVEKEFGDDFRNVAV